jgi:predicted TIM-barrel fold metal-dependent hydrolase
MSVKGIPLSQPPLRASQPRRRAPQGAIDCHFHIFGPETKYALSPSRGYTPHPDANIDAYREMAEVIGIERVVIVNPTPYRTDHECTIDSIKVFGRDRAKGVAVINKDTTDEQVRRLAANGFVAARVNNVNAGTTTVGEMEDVIKRIIPLGWHIEVYVEGEELPSLEKKLLDLPMNVVIDHMGRIPTTRGVDCPEFKCLLRLLESGKVWVKLSGFRSSVEGPPYSDLLVPARKIIETAPERCVWGTDWPHARRTGPLMVDDGKLLDLLSDWAPDPRLFHRILVDNPTELYGFQQKLQAR